MNKKIRRIIETLGQHEDNQAISVLEELGTNSSDDEVRELTSQMLVRKNIHDALKVVIINKGKGINDMSPVFSMSTINEILNLENKEEAVKILDDTINMHSDEEVRENAKSVKSLLSLA